MNRYWCACFALVFKCCRSFRGHAWCHKICFLLTFKGNCVILYWNWIFLFQNSQWPQKSLVQILMRHPVDNNEPDQNLKIVSQILIGLILLIKTPNIGFLWVLKLFLGMIDQSNTKICVQSNFNLVSPDCFLLVIT